MLQCTLPFRNRQISNAEPVKQRLPTHLQKSSRGGIMGHRYLNLQDDVPALRKMTLLEIATELKAKTWS